MNAVDYPHPCYREGRAWRRNAPKRSAGPVGKWRLVVREQRPAKELAELAVLVLLLVLAAGIIYAQGRAMSESERIAVALERDRLAARNQELKSANDALRARVATLERTAQIERATYDDIDNTLRLLQARVLGLEEELGFYRGIVVSADRGSGLAIESFDVVADGSGREYRFRIVLTQFRNNDKVTRGKIHFSVLGKHQGEAARLSLADVSDNSDKGIAFHFRNFHSVEGPLALPSGFVPQQVVVRVIPDGDASAIVKKAFVWPGRRGTG